MSADFLKLFYNRRLTMAEPTHAAYIKGRLSAMKAENDQRYEEYSEFYNVVTDVNIVVGEDDSEKVEKKKPGRKPGRKPANKAKKTE